MMKVKGKWMRLMSLLGCTVWMASCQEAPTQPTGGGASYETMRVVNSDKEFVTDYSASIRGRYDASIFASIGNHPTGDGE